MSTGRRKIPTRSVTLTLDEVVGALNAIARVVQKPAPDNGKDLPFRLTMLRKALTSVTEEETAYSIQRERLFRDYTAERIADNPQNGQTKERYFESDVKYIDFMKKLKELLAIETTITIPYVTLAEIKAITLSPPLTMEEEVALDAVTTVEVAE